ncbi:MAG TPA: hypothetical protein VFW09_18200 [Solirubrobacteraceae bacterium]|nr:hypothetical protein [Solirubrobacteraceae bacterium]
MLIIEHYPTVLKSAGPRGRPRHVEPLSSGYWRVDWIDGWCPRRAGTRALTCGWATNRSIYCEPTRDDRGGLEGEWSKLDTRWKGVSLDTLLENVQPSRRAIRVGDEIGEQARRVDHEAA